MRKLIIFLASAAVMAGCADIERDVTAARGTPGVVYAAAAHESGLQTRVSFSENSAFNELEVRWNAEGESFSVYSGTASQVPVTFDQTSVSADGCTAGFMAVDYALEEGSEYYAIYPAQLSRQAPTAVLLDLTKQNGAEYNAGAAKTFMYAKSVCTDADAPLSFTFRHLTAAVRLDVILPDGVDAASAERALVSAGNGLAVSAKCSISGYKPVFTPVAGGRGIIGLDGPFEIREVSGKKTVTLYFRMLPDNVTDLKAEILIGGRCYEAGLAGERNFMPGNWYFTVEAKEAVMNPAVMKVISFNVRTSTADDGITNLFDGKSWSVRKSAAASLLKSESPAVFGVQEATKTQLDYLKGQLSGYGCYGLGRDDGADAGEIMAVFYNTSEVTLGNHGTFWLSETPDEVSKGWGANYFRTATWAIFTHIGTGKEFFYLNTHLDHEVAAARTNSIALIIEKIRALNPENYPVVITGDFNAKPDDAVLDPLEEVFANTRVSSPFADNTVTYNNYGEGNEKIIDHIFISPGFRPLEYRTITDKVGSATYVSDHYPISSLLVFE